MNIKKWSEKTIREFFKAYSFHGCLWDTTLPSYKFKSCRRAALEDIVRALNIDEFTVFDLKTKINILRSTYTQELKKVFASSLPGSTCDPYVPTLPWFYLADSFLRPHVTHRSLALEKRFREEDRVDTETLNDDNTIEEEKQVYCSSKYSSDGENNVEVEITEDPVATDSPASIVPGNSRPHPGLQPTYGARKSRKRHYCVDDQDQNANQLQYAVEELRTISSTIQELQSSDELDLFGKGVAAQMRKLPEEYQIEAMSEIQALLGQKRLRYIEEKKQGTVHIY